MTSHSERLREAEFNVVKDYFSPELRVLELGGGNGFQALLIDARGCQVSSIDVAPPSHRIQYFPVQGYDGRAIPYPSDEFDLIFSSNVLEHIDDLDATLRESLRVLKPDGVAIHILPTPAWRLWTSLAHYGYLLQRVLDADRPVGDGSVPSLTEKMHSRGMIYAVRRVLAAGPHGRYPGALSELYYFSEGRWLKVFQRAGFRVMQAKASDIFYTGYGLLPRLSLSTRISMARWLGAATRIYVLRKA